MNDLEFRAWYKPGQKMYPVLSLDFHSVNGSVNGVFLTVSPYTIPMGHFILMQYTGLKDMHEKKIFQGDIIRRGYLALNDVSKFGLEPWNHLPEEVQESDLTTTLETWVVGWDIYDLCKLSEAVRSNPDVVGVEVIGNIYEHEALIPNEWKLWNKYNKQGE